MKDTTKPARDAMQRVNEHWLKGQREQANDHALQGAVLKYELGATPSTLSVLLNICQTLAKELDIDRTSTLDYEEMIAAAKMLQEALESALEEQL